MSAKPKTTRQTGARSEHQAHLNSIAEHLGDRFETRVKVSMGSNKGSITIDFATMTDLNRILAELGEDGALG